MWLIIIAFILFIAYAGLLAYYTMGWFNVPSFQTNASTPKTKISIIVPARNEEQHIQECINSILQQNYPQHLFEIIVMDDFSNDRTVDLITEVQTAQVKLLQLKNFVDSKINSYKKKAIEIGVAHASGELIVTTDADCFMDKNWLRTIAQFYEATNAQLIAMPVAFDHRSSLLSVFQTIDFLTLQGITAAGVHTRFHTMCNGANLAYTKKAFDAVNGFKGIDNIASGDDMLLMHKIFKQHPEDIKYLKSKEVIVQTATAKNWDEFYHQRVRWASKADKYEDKRIFAALVLVYLVNVFMLGLVASILFDVNNGWLLLACWGIKTLLELPLVLGAANFFKKQSLIWLFHFLQPLHWLYMVWVGLIGKVGKYQWKGREVQ
jgi:cellulose synthase/poly-beta-1,6-N-acetylglucosamine synthase-like glycosyltransferase